VSVEQGKAYLETIEKEFSGVIGSDDIKKFVKIMDKVGQPVRSLFTTEDKTLIYCSPSAFRYLFHALLILKHYKENGSQSIVEVGCGYGGLMLAIGFLASKMDCTISKYHLVDLPEVGTLLEKFLGVLKEHIPFEYQIHSSEDVGKEVTGNGLFFISNYALSAFENSVQKSYKPLISKTEHGFIVWQTSFGMNIRGVVSHSISSIVEERPQTAPEHVKNYFIYF
jgi:hypothetical protein